MDSPPADSVTLPASMDSESFAACRQHLSEALGGKGALRLDASGIERLTTPYAQLLLACLTAKGGEVRIATPSPEFCAAWQTLGLTNAFPLEAEA